MPLKKAQNVLVISIQGVNMKKLLHSKYLTIFDILVFSSSLFLILLGLVLFALYRHPYHIIMLLLGHFFGTIWISLRTLFTKGHI